MSDTLSRQLLLRCPHIQRDARYMRHATQEDLDQLEVLLAAGSYYVDVKFDGKFQRMKVTSHSDQALALTRVKEALRSNGRPAANPEVRDFPPGTGIPPRISEPQKAGERD